MLNIIIEEEKQILKELNCFQVRFLGMKRGTLEDRQYVWFLKKWDLII